MYLRNIIIYKHLFNVSIVRIKVARSTIGYSEVFQKLGGKSSGNVGRTHHMHTHSI
jgi:hypothetical protein